MKLYFALVCLFARLSYSLGDQKIYGGYPIDISDAPYMAYITYHLYSNETYGIDSLCGGTIISRQYVLTAGHCTTDNVNGAYQTRRAANYSVRVGSTKSDKNGQLYYVSNVYPHPDYTPAAAYHDVGLLKLTQKLRYNYNNADGSSTINKVMLAGYNDQIQDGGPALVSGWGANPMHPNTDKLYQVQVNIVNSTECARKWGGSSSDYEQHEVCALARNRDACQGDSGGPLTMDYNGKEKQIGVVSYGATCDDNPRRLPGVYAKIQDNLKFIHSVTRQ